MNNIFDAVITWVDGSDPIHISKRNQYLSSPEAGTTSCGVLDWRFIEVGEVKYCIYSIRKFAPWIRNIYMVTDEQIPSWLTKKIQDKLGVFIIDHKIIFRDYLDCLPTFNTMSINSMLHRIPGLSNKYVVLNDDCFFIDEIKVEDFFAGEKSILRGQVKKVKVDFWKRIKRVMKNILTTKSLKKALQKQPNPFGTGSKIVGLEDKYFETTHAPDSYCIDTLNEFYFANTNFFDNNIKYKFRNTKQTSSAAIFPQIMLKNGRAVIIDGSDAEMIIPGYGGLKGLKGQREKFDALKRGNHGKKFLCFQDLAFLKQENPEEFQEVIDWLEDTIMK